MGYENQSLRNIIDQCLSYEQYNENKYLS